MILQKHVAEDLTVVGSVVIMKEMGLGCWEGVIEVGGTESQNQCLALI